MHILPSRAFTSTNPAWTDRTTCHTTLAKSIGEARVRRSPYPHWLLAEALPLDLAWALAKLPLALPRAAYMGCPKPPTAVRHPITRRESGLFDACRLVADTFQSAEAAALIARLGGIDLEGCRLRISLTRELDGYQCPPATRQGEALFCLMVALDCGGQRNLGPDIYSAEGDWAGQAPWTAGCALAFAPSERSLLGFEPRMIRGVRSSLIIDYVPAGRGDPAELAFPDWPVGWGF